MIVPLPRRPFLGTPGVMPRLVPSNLLVCLGALLLFACPKAEAPQTPPPEAKAEAPTPSPAAPVAPASPAPAAMTLDDTPDVVCHYVLKDVMTETLGDQTTAGHEVEVQYDLRTLSTQTGTPAYALNVRHVSLNGKREAYAVKLDSNDHGQMVRAKGGADTLLMFDAVLYLALLEHELIFEVSPGGKLRAVHGAPALRETYLAMHPAKPRADPHQIARVAVALSDDALARRFLPFAALAPSQVDLHPQTSAQTKGAMDWAEYPADTLSAVRVRWFKDQMLIEEKRAFAPSAREPKYPPHKGYPKVTLRSASGDAIVGLRPDSPCFVRAASHFETARTWTGMLDEEEITTEQKTTSVWVVEAAESQNP